ncbi:MAG: redox-sensing transcriptional repressor Rex [Candidatus Bathyarchaeia archaeon]
MSEKVIERFCQIRRYLRDLKRSGHEYVFSHELAHSLKINAAQIRQDLKILGTLGKPNRGYRIDQFLNTIEEFLYPQMEIPNVALFGVGNLGRAILAYLGKQHHSLRVSLAFDVDPLRVNRVIMGVYCYHVDQLEAVIKEKPFQIAVLCVPKDSAESLCNRLINRNIRGILNFVPFTPQVPPHIYVENVDLSVLLEKVAFFSCHVDI